MSHNLHLIVVNAESPEDACNSAESSILEWGDDNNWRAMCGCVSEDNEVYDVKGEGYSPTEVLDIQPNSVKFATGQTYTPIQLINNIVMGWMEISERENNQIKTLLDIHYQGKEVGSYGWYEIKKFAEKQQMLANTDTKNFDVFKHTYYNYTFDENGVTDLTVEAGKKYVVFINMHS